MKNTMKTIFSLVIVLGSLSTLADEGDFYCTVGAGHVSNKTTEVYDGLTLHIASGYKVTRNFGLEASYDYSKGGVATSSVWFERREPASFDNIHMLGVFGTGEWNVNSKVSFLSKIGVARGIVDYRGVESRSSGSINETNLVAVLGIAVPIHENFDVTISIREQFSADFFGLTDSFDSSTVGVNLRIRW